MSAGPSEITAVDIFSGCGGLTTGLKLAGFRVVGAIEIDDLAVETYRANHPEVPVFNRDIRDLDPTHFSRELQVGAGELGLLAGCPPCQGYSTLRTLNGARKICDARNDLIFDFLRFVEILHPKAVMLENVPGLSKAKEFSEFVARLRAWGYFPNVRILDAARFGVPQRRLRMILLAGRGNNFNFPAEIPIEKNVLNTIGNLRTAGHSGDPLHDFPEKRNKRITRVIKGIPKNGGSRLDLPLALRLPCHENSTGFRDVYGRMAWEAVAPTLTAGCINPSKGRFLHPEENRAITLREAALLQSFPGNYFFSLRKGKFAVAKMIGNAIPPELIRRLAMNIRKYF